MISPVGKLLEERSIAFREFTHPGPVTSLEQAARERDQLPEQVVRSILFRVADREYIMVLVGGPQQIAWPALRRQIGRSRISMASREEVKEATGFEIGSVSPFALPGPIPILVDQSVLDQDEISLGSGLRGTTIFMKVKDMLDALGEYEKGDLLDKT